MFAPAWSTRSVDDDPGVPFFNDTPKYVVSSSLTSADAWQNSTVLGGYDAQAISELKEQDGDVYISGSGTLVRALLADGLVDELHLLVYPVVLGAGARLFPDGAPADVADAGGARGVRERRPAPDLRARGALIPPHRPTAGGAAVRGCAAMDA